MSYSEILVWATAAAEIAAAGWTLLGRFRRGSRAVVETAVAILLLLAGYPLAEVAICARVDAAGFLPRLAFLFVTWLPPLGLLLVAQLSPSRSLLLRGSATAALVAAFALNL